MTNKIWNLKDRFGNTIPVVFTDNGDGTYTFQTNTGSSGSSSVTTLPYNGSISATVVVLAAATSAQLIASNSTRKGLRWQNVGVNPATVVPGGSAAVVGQGLNYSPPNSVGFQGGGESFEGNAVPTNAFQAISTLGTTIIVWEQT